MRKTSLQPGVVWGTILVLVYLSGLCLAKSNVRYALIIGNNQANPQLTQLKELRHAEREAAQIRANLIQYGNFDPKRTVLVV